MKLTLKGAQKKLDKLWRTIGREEAVCEVCETLPLSERVNYTQLHPHHVIGRKNKALRWSFINRCWLCPTHHTLGNISAHNDPKWFLDWFAKNHSEDWDFILKEKNKVYKRVLDDYIKMIEELG